MKKTKILRIIISLIFLIIFNASFFAIGGAEHNMSVWASYGFIHFAYIMLLLTSKLIRKGKSSAIFGYSLYSISASYFLIEFITGITFILVSPESPAVALLIQLCMVGLYGIILISYMIADEHTANAEEKRQYQIAYVKDASAKLKTLLESISDKETKKKIERLYDTLYSSPVRTHPNLADIENRILASIGELEYTVAAGNKEGITLLANSLLLLINERNNILKSL
ncbi:MAG: hypothetical protein LBB36_07240 [Fibromonadaceae bacterium]|jgi:hypothetical protein|nr:hypothetical protein [Fibromonadaceae bacterium]